MHFQIWAYTSSWRICKQATQGHFPVACHQTDAKHLFSWFTGAMQFILAMASSVKVQILWRCVRKPGLHSWVQGQTLCACSAASMMLAPLHRTPRFLSLQVHQCAACALMCSVAVLVCGVTTTHMPIRMALPTCAVPANGLY